jgi:transmembrane sensor
MRCAASPPTIQTRPESNFVSSHESRTSEQDTAIQQAAEWMARISDPEAGIADFREWQEWLNAAPRHAAAYREIEEIWALTGGYRDAGAGVLPATEPAANEVVAATPTRRTHGRRVAWSAAAGVLVAIGGIAIWYSQRTVSYVFETATAEQRSMQLADGSHVIVGAETKVSIDLGPSQRSLHLDHGVAYFKVAPDKSRPFVVASDGYVSQAVGTAFAVDSQPHRMLVSVDEGTVRVAPAGSGEGAGSIPNMLVHAGQRATVDDQGMRCMSMPHSDDTTPAWANGRLEYLHEELRFVIADVNRYSQRKIQLDDAQVGRIFYTGTVLLDHVDEWVATLPGSFPVRLDTQQHGSGYLLSATPEIDGESRDRGPAELPHADTSHGC